MKYTYLVFALTLSIIAYAQSPVIMDNLGKKLSFDELMMKATASDVIFFGETHDDSLAHVLQLKALNWLIERKVKVGLSLEMFETDVQGILNEYLSGLISENSFEKDARPWNNYEDYKPLVEAQKRNKGSIIAANAPRRYIRMVTKDGLGSLQNLPKESKKYLPKLPIKILDGRYKSKFNEIMGEHQNMVSNIYLSQNLWDATMANSIYNYQKQNKNHKVLHLCGSFHCEEGLGTVEQLKRLNLKSSIFIIVALSKENYEKIKPEYRQNLANAIIITK